jgi:hypothetical protein
VPHLDRLVSLNLCNNRLSHKSLVGLLNNCMTKPLVRLDISQNQLGGRAVLALVELIRKSGTLSDLNIAKGGLDAQVKADTGTDTQ